MPKSIESRQSIDLSGIIRVDSPPTVPTTRRGSAYFMGETPLVRLDFTAGDNFYCLYWDTTEANLKSAAPFSRALQEASKSGLPGSGTKKRVELSWLTAEGELRGDNPLSLHKEIIPFDNVLSDKSKRKVTQHLRLDWSNLVSARMTATDDDKDQFVLWLDGLKTDLPRQIGLEAPLSFSPLRSAAALLRRTNPAFNHTNQAVVDQFLSRVCRENGLSAAT